MHRSGQAIQYSWPLKERPLHFELGSMLECAWSDLDNAPAQGQRVGWWECDLADNRLSWTGGVYDIFGLPRGASITRSEALSRYTEHSRAILERLRSDSIRNRCGFTLDAQLTAASGDDRWIRVIGAPDIAGGQVVRLHGLKMLL